LQNRSSNESQKNVYRSTSTNQTIDEFLKVLILLLTCVESAKLLNCCKICAYDLDLHESCYSLTTHRIKQWVFSHKLWFLRSNYFCLSDMLLLVIVITLLFSVQLTDKATQNLLLSVRGKRITPDAARPLRSCRRHC